MIILAFEPTKRRKEKGNHEILLLNRKVAIGFLVREFKFESFIIKVKVLVKMPQGIGVLMTVLKWL